MDDFVWEIQAVASDFMSYKEPDQQFEASPIRRVKSSTAHTNRSINLTVPHQNRRDNRSSQSHNKSQGTMEYRRTSVGSSESNLTTSYRMSHENLSSGNSKNNIQMQHPIQGTNVIMYDERRRNMEESQNLSNTISADEERSERSRRSSVPNPEPYTDTSSVNNSSPFEGSPKQYMHQVEGYRSLTPPSWLSKRYSPTDNSAPNMSQCYVGSDEDSCYDFPVNREPINETENPVNGVHSSRSLSKLSAYTDGEAPKQETNIAISKKGPLARQQEHIRQPLYSLNKIKTTEAKHFMARRRAQYNKNDSNIRFPNKGIRSSARGKYTDVIVPCVQTTV